MEIGSEFWQYDGELLSDNTKFWNIGKDREFLLSGRTAIYFVLQEILKKQKVEKVYLPSYSCHSMAQPFLESDIKVEYYDVAFEDSLKYNIDTEKDCDIFFAMNYFGYTATNMENYIKKFKDRGITVIEDITHSILSEKKYSVYSDYLVGSLRKWFPIASGGIAISMEKDFKIQECIETNQNLIISKKTAMSQKKDYIENIDTSIKQNFLNEFSKSNEILSEDYKNYRIDENSYKILMGLDIEKIQNSRRENAKIIYEKLKDIKEIRFLVNNLLNEDCPLFVPIILQENLRNNLRKILIENQVYCPIHWPLDQNLNNIFNKELSLICDQRYTKKEIEEYLKIIVNFFS